MKNVLSCIQPTGDLHLGNYFGAVQNWVRLQDQYQCLYGVVDNHAMTMPYKAEQLRENTWRQRSYFMFDRHADRLLAFFREVLRQRPGG